MPGYVVIGDLGGTSCRLELVPCDGSAVGALERPKAAHRAKYKSNSADSLSELLARFVAEPECAAAVLEGGPVQLFSIAVCGPVTDGRAILLAPGFGEGGWTLDARAMKLDLGVEVAMLNDFHAVGLGLPHIPTAELHTVHGAGGRRDPRGVLACLGPGTGLGQVFAVPREEAAGGGYHVCCSEGGMSDFVARTEDEWALRRFIANGCSDGFVEVEKVVSGEGIAHIYRWLREARPALLVDAALDAAVLGADEPAAVIAQHCTAGEVGADALCVAAVDIFLDALGAEAGNLAVRYQAKGGVYIAGGGIASKLLPRILDGRVAAAFVAKGHSIACYDDVPLFVATTPGDELGLLGAWEWAQTQLRVVA